MRKILQAQIKTIDDKNHVKIWTEKDIAAIVFKGDKTEKPTKKEEPPKESVAKKITKKVTKKK